MPADQAERPYPAAEACERTIGGIGALCRSDDRLRLIRAVTAAGRMNRTLSTSSEFDVYPDFLSLLSAVLLVNGRTNQPYCVKAAIVQSRYNTAALKRDKNIRSCPTRLFHRCGRGTEPRIKLSDCQT